MILILEMLKLKKKIKLSNILERVEIDSESKEIIEMLDNYHSNPKAHVIGITGPPGVGKSSLINNLIKNIRKNKRSVGIIAIDPSSTESGGALLGDRTRFTFDFKDENVFVRSMATKNHLGGVSELTYPTMAVAYVVLSAMHFYISNVHVYLSLLALPIMQNQQNLS